MSDTVIIRLPGAPRGKGRHRAQLVHRGSMSLREVFGEWNAGLPSLPSLPLPVAQGGVGNSTGDVGNLNFTGRGPAIMSLTKRLADRVDIREWSSVDLTGNNPNDSIVASWLTQAMQSGLPAYAPPGLCMLDVGTSVTMTADVELNLPRKFILKSTPNCAKPLLNFTSPTRDLYGLTLRGGTIQNTLGTLTVGGQSNTGLGMVRLARVKIEDALFLGGTSLDNAAATTDSGISWIDCRNVLISNSDFIGQGDCGIYGGGNADNTTSVDDGGEHRIVGCYFRWCGNATNIKRQGPRTIFGLNNVLECGFGFLNWEVTVTEPGRQSLVIGNIFKKTRNTAIDLRYCTGGKAASNYIEDFGCLDDGVTAGQTPIAIRLHGMDNGVCSDNDIIMAEWTTTTSHTAYSVDGMVLNSLTKVGQNNCINGGRIKGVYTGVSEGTNTAANSYDNIAMQGVTVPYTPSVITNSSNIRHPIANGWSFGNSSTGNVAGVQIGRDGIINARRGTNPFIANLLSAAGNFVAMQVNATTIAAVSYGGFAGLSNAVALSGQSANTPVGLAPNGTGYSFTTAPFQFQGYTFSGLPSASAYSNTTVRITDRNQRLATSDGTNWRFTDGTIAA